ncbi:hypothetical protein L1987_12170 [Smallanthus sonchifolius]|uniref:Uncharacterized protein n=1 Tax=Smallanthus sonchifolius TaxID=185202 RepID=A0ACB9JF52_9ASTR|nr:hypothetical protein L1987_12170 [Smallanthus sonchifolius]
MSLHSSPHTWSILPHAKNLSGTWNIVARLENSLTNIGLHLGNLTKGVVGNALDNDKGCLLGTRYEMNNQSVQWKWRWKRPPNGPIEMAEFSDLSNLISQVTFCDFVDKWDWPKEASGKFSVESTTCALCRDAQETVDHKFIACEVASRIWQLSANLCFFDPVDTKT